MPWGSVHKNHAIERMRFEMLFSDPLSKKIIDKLALAIEAKRERLRFEPKQDQQVHNIVIGNGPMPPSVNHAAGWVFVRKSRADVVSEALALNSDSLVYESTDYRDWTTAKKRYLNMVSELVHEIAAVVDVRAFMHDFTDRFIFNGPVEDARPSDILSDEIVATISASAREGQVLFHVHRGWFDSALSKPYLVNQNVDAQQAAMQNGNDARSIQIFTRVEMRPVLGSFETSSLDAYIEEMHILCNKTFSNALSPAGRALLNIDENGAGGVD